MRCAHLLSYAETRYFTGTFLEIQGSAGGAYVYVLTVSGFAYLFRLRNLGAYVSGSVFPETDLMVVDLRAQNSQDVKTTRISALPGLLVLGRSDGSVGCFEFGTPVPGSQSSTYELRDVGLSRIWGLVSRTNVSSSVWSLALSEVHGRKLVYVLHADGSMRVWDLNGRLKIFSHNLGLPEIAGNAFPHELLLLVTSRRGSYHPIRFWVSDANNDNGEMFIAALYGSESGQEVVVVHGLHISLANKLSLALTSSIRHVVIDKDCWFIASMSISFLESVFGDHRVHDSIDDLMYTSCSISSSMKGLTLSSGIGMQMDQSWDTIIQGDAANPFSIACSWKRFCSNYFQCWCQNCIPYGLLIDNSTGAVGLIRKNSFSLFRCLEDIEILAYGSFGAFSDFVDIGVNLSDDVLDCEILFKVLKFSGYISQHLGEAAAPVLYESLANPLSISFDDAMSCILKILERGYDLSTTEHYISVFGVDSVWEKKQAQHTKQRKFSINSLLSLTALYNKAGSWTRVLNVVENYVRRLICRKGDVRLAVDAKGLSNVNTSLLAVSVSHFARVMFESACGLLVFLGHICNVQGQVQVSFDDSSKIKLDLIPLIQNILLRWFIVHMLASRPCESVALEDFSYQLSSLHIGTSLAACIVVFVIYYYDVFSDVIFSELH
ncbi:Nuclear pore complex protein [Nymphaea thermarum]|nr:Nuclear pore complex protein [Nymphaea thermarum]